MSDQNKNKKQNGSSRTLWLVVLQLTMLLYATTSIFSKNASRYPFASLPFILFYGGMIGVLVVYAVLWQQVITHLPLTLAFANKAVNILWGVVFGIAFFSESINGVQAAGCLVIMLGTVLYMRADQKQLREEAQRAAESVSAGTDSEKTEVRV